MIFWIRAAFTLALWGLSIVTGFQSSDAVAHDRTHSAVLLLLACLLCAVAALLIRPGTKRGDDW